MGRTGFKRFQFKYRSSVLVPMSAQPLQRISAAAGAIAAAMTLTSCAVGPDFLHPAAPEITRYTREPLSSRTSSSGAPTGLSQRFVEGRDIPLEWWRLFRSRALNALIERAIVVQRIGSKPMHSKTKHRLRTLRQIKLQKRPENN